MTIRKWLNRLKVEDGQSVLEYSAIAMMIMIGILVIGPYVVRSINAYFKGAEDQAHDSFREEIRQARLQGDELAYNLGDCDCEYKDPAVCSSDASLCPLTQLMRPLVCDPPGCLGPSSGPRAQCMIEELPTTAKTWQDCYVENNEMYPIGEEGYQEWRDEGCGYECCTEAELVAPWCWFPNEVMYMTSDSHEDAQGWRLSEGDKILSTRDNKIYTVMGPKMPPDAVAYWKFESNAEDSIGDYHGTIYGNVPFVSGQVGQAVSFDGSVDDPANPSTNLTDYNYIAVENPAIMNFGDSTDFTFSAWIKPKYLDDTSLCLGNIFSRRDQRIPASEPSDCATGDGGRGFVFYMDYYGGNGLSLQFNNGEEHVNYWSGSPALYDGYWHHVAVTADRDGCLVFYVDGEPIRSLDLSVGIWDISSQSDLFIGLSERNAPHSRFNGDMDEFIVYRMVLSSDEIKQIYDTQSKEPGEWDGDEVEWSSGQDVAAGTPIHVLYLSSITVVFDGEKWTETDGSGETKGYVKMRRWCGDKADVAQDFWEPSDDCQYSCEGKDERAFWCGDSYNYGLTEDLEAKHVKECYPDPADNKCVAFCPDDRDWTYPGTLEVHESDGCVCRDLWEWNLATNQCDCFAPNEIVDGECVFVNQKKCRYDDANLVSAYWGGMGCSGSFFLIKWEGGVIINSCSKSGFETYCLNKVPFEHDGYKYTYGEFKGEGGGRSTCCSRSYNPANYEVCREPL